MPARKKITDTPDGPKPKRVMTPEQLEKLAAAREKAKAVKDAMKSENDEHKIRILQAKMDAIKKTSKKKPDPPKPTNVPDLEEEPLVPEPNVMTEPEPLQEDKLPNVPEEEPEPPEPPAHAHVPAPAKTAKPKKGKKPVVIVDDSGSDSSDDNDNSNVIYIRRKKKKPQKTLPPPPQRTEAPEVKHPPANPFFTYQWSHKNFQ